MRRACFAAVTLAVALFAAGGVGAGTSHDSVSGAGAVTAPDLSEHDQFSVGAGSDPGGSNPMGEVTLELSAPPGSPPTAYQGDVSQGCLIVNGNTAIAVGKLPDREVFSVDGRTVDYLAVSVVDNGNPVMGVPTDQASGILLFDTTEQRVCAGLRTLPIFPLDHGNFVVQDAS